MLYSSWKSTPNGNMVEKESDTKSVLKKKQFIKIWIFIGGNFILTCPRDMYNDKKITFFDFWTGHFSPEFAIKFIQICYLFGFYYTE